MSIPRFSPSLSQGKVPVPGVSSVFRVIFPPQTEISLNAIFLPRFDVIRFTALLNDFVFAVPLAHQPGAAPECKRCIRQPQNNDENDQGQNILPINSHSAPASGAAVINLFRFSYSWPLCTKPDIVNRDCREMVWEETKAEAGTFMIKLGWWKKWGTRQNRSGWTHEGAEERFFSP
jgi:hypothetical protein